MEISTKIKFLPGGGGIFLVNLKKAKRFDIILASMVH